MTDFIVGTAGTAEDFGSVKDGYVRWTRAQFRANNSASRAFILALAAKHPLSLITGKAIDAAQALSSFNKKQFHHIYPAAYLKREKAPGQHNALANICMLPAAENLEISDSNPHEYLPRCLAGLGTHADAVFGSNFLPSPSVLHFATASYEEFLRARALLLSDFIQRLCSGHKP